MNTLYHYRREQVFGERGDAIFVGRIDAHRPARPHEHDFIEVVLTVGGTARQRTAQRCLPVKRGTLTILRPGHWHSYEEPRGLAIYNCLFGPELLRRELAWLIDNPVLTSLLWGSGDVSGGTGPLMFQLPSAALKPLEEILERFESCRRSSFDIKVSWLCLFLTTLAEILQKQVKPNGEKNRLHVVVAKIVRLVEFDLARAWTIGDLARECGCSPEYAVRLFKATMGLPPHAYINRCRAERAAKLLLRTDSTIKEIGAQIGWPEPCHFARRFKQEFGVAATLYREQRERR